MTVAALVGILVYFLVNFALGLRLVRIGLLSRHWPELALGVFFLVGAPMGYAVGMALHFLGLVPSPLDGPVATFSLLAANVGTAGLLWFTQLTFRERSSGAAICVYVGAGVMAVAYVWQALTVGFGAGRIVGVAYSLGFLVRFGSFIWAGTESLLRMQQIRRRARVGRGDPVLARTFFLWGMACVSLTLPFAAHLAMQRVATEAVFAEESALIYSVFGALAAALTWLAFGSPAVEGEPSEPEPA